MLLGELELGALKSMPQSLPPEKSYSPARPFLPPPSTLSARNFRAKPGTNSALYRSIKWGAGKLRATKNCLSSFRQNRRGSERASDATRTRVIQALVQFHQAKFVSLSGLEMQLGDVLSDSFYVRNRSIKKAGAARQYL